MEPRSVQSSIETIADGLRAIVEPGAVFEVRALKASRPGQSYEATWSGYFDDVNVAADAIGDVDGLARGIYMTLNPVDPALLARATNRMRQVRNGDPTTKDGEVLCRARVLIDVDPDRAAGISSTEAEHQAAITRALAIRDALRGLGAPEMTVVDSGNGAQVIGAIELPADDGGLVKRVLAGLSFRFSDDAVRVDTGVFNPARIVKVPGTLTRKGDDTPERPHRRAQILERPQTLLPINRDLLEVIASWAPAATARPAGKHQGKRLDLDVWLSRHNVETRRSRAWNGGTISNIPCPLNPEHGFDAWAGQDGAGALSAACFHQTCALKSWADLRAIYEPERAAGSRRADARRTPGAESKEGRATDEPQNSAEGVEAAADFYPAERPEIVDRADAEVFREAEAALLAWPESGVYSRGNLLVKIIRTSEPTFGGRKAKTIHRPANAPTIAPIDKDFLCLRLERAARWFRFVKARPGSEAAMRGEKYEKVKADAPMRIARGIMAENVLPYPALEGIAEAPVFLPSGEVLERPGYDEQSGLWYAPAADYPPVPSSPDHAAAVRAAAEILEPFDEFPFVEDVDRAAFLAYVLSPLARTAIDEPAPMTSFDSPIRGSGKSKLATLGGMIGTGREPALMVPTDDDEELRKAALAFGLEGTRLCIIDNAAGAFGSKQFAAILTMRTISGRVLGVSKTATVPLRAVWAITGNNLTFKGDLPRRVMHVRIDPKMEHPENREFKIANLSEHVREERARLVVAGLTILRAFHLAGRPHNKRPGRGFEAWCALVRSAVEWAIKVDPWPESPDGGDDNDSEHEALRHALVAWEETFGEVPTTAAAACARAMGNPEFQATLALFVGIPVARLDARALGYRLRHSRNQIASDPDKGALKFVKEGEDRIAGARWTVQVVKPAEAGA